MSTTAVVIIVIVLLALFGAVAYFFIRETGMQQARLWFVSSSQFRKLFSASGGSTAGARAEDDERGVVSETRTIDVPAQRPAASMPTGTRPATTVIDDSGLRELREELHGELRRASGLTREFDARLTRIEAASTDLPQISEQLQRTVEQRTAEQRREIERLKNDLARVQQSSGARGERRSEAVADLYGHLARVEASLAAVVNPMLLPGETLTIPEEFTQDALDWENWNDVGERAFAFANAFNQNRFVLDSAMADEIERFIGTLRQGLTGAIYPNLRSPNPSQAQRAQMRAGLTSIVSELPQVRRKLEQVYRDEPPANDSPDATP